MNEVLVREEEERENEVHVAPFTDAEVLAMLHVIQDLDPPGVGALYLRECLLLQLSAAGQRESLAYRLVDESFDELIAHRLAASLRNASASARRRFRRRPTRSPNSITSPGCASAPAATTTSSPISWSSVSTASITSSSTTATCRA